MYVCISSTLDSTQFDKELKQRNQYLEMSTEILHGKLSRLEIQNNICKKRF